LLNRVHFLRCPISRIRKKCPTNRNLREAFRVRGDQSRSVK
jgi:hypothetical protein